MLEISMQKQKHLGIELENKAISVSNFTFVLNFSSTNPRRYGVLFQSFSKA